MYSSLFNSFDKKAQINSMNAKTFVQEQKNMKNIFQSKNMILSSRNDRFFN